MEKIEVYPGLTITSIGTFIQNGKNISPWIHRVSSKKGNVTESLRIKIRVNGKNKEINCAKFIATFFNPNPFNYYHLFFLDGNRLNINKDNLKWVDFKGTNIYSKRKIKEIVDLNETQLSESLKHSIKNLDFNVLIKELKPFIPKRIPLDFYFSELYNELLYANQRSKGLLNGINDKMWTKYINRTIKFRYIDYLKNIGSDINSCRFL